MFNARRPKLFGIPLRFFKIWKIARKTKLASTKAYFWLENVWKVKKMLISGHLSCYQVKIVLEPDGFKMYFKSAI